MISPALPGFGESHEAQSLDSINDMAKFVINIIDEKKIKNFKYKCIPLVISRKYDYLLQSFLPQF